VVLVVWPLPLRLPMKLTPEKLMVPELDKSGSVVAVFCAITVLIRFSVPPLLAIAPPVWAELPEIVQCVSVAIPAFEITSPNRPLPRDAWLPEKVQRVRVRVPALYIAAAKSLSIPFA
jgi:hypothetical protein